MALWHAGIMQSMDDTVLYEPESYGIDFQSSVSEIDDDCSVVVSENQIQLSEQEKSDLRSHVPDDGNSGIDLYIKVCNTIKTMRNLPS